MVYLGVCCASLKDNKALMKMGLGLVLVGHVNFLLGALVHGAVLRHINVHSQARTMVYAISNVIAIVAGLVGIIGGITAIVLSKNKKNRILQWVLLVFGFLAGLLAVASTLGLSVSMVKAIMDKGKGLLTHCRNSNNNVGSSSITYECPFDPTRIYATTIILWVPLILMSVVEMVFSFRCFAACTTLLYLCPCRRRPIQAKRVRIQRRIETPTPARDPEISAEAEPAERDELLDGNTAVEQSEWL
ncbi:keratinocyte-associated protein 3-like [Seriola dumerili]|uniref:keratinocyte-associated protein 3-like n=1 Tax=Seriola dumerili TaxID=41447 RepID=UPI000BBECB31|nr:keratinocyte-associated protein 3-like [Seriola dumerili]